MLCVDALAELVSRGGVAVLSGAGLSTESGIPDYRGETGAQRHHTPMTYQTFTRDPAARHRYWARSYLGWRQIRQARPNAGHRAVAALQQGGFLLDQVITQNVDGLHQAAGATGVIELHGGLDRVICLNCGRTSDRGRLDRRLAEANPTFAARTEQADEQVNPDGDVDLAEAALAGFVMVDCEDCGDGPLKPDVVFFGETVPRPRVEDCFDLVDAATSLLVLGSSLKVMSGFRFVLRAAKLRIPVAIVNQGPTRGDGYCDVRVDAALGTALTRLGEELAAPRVPVYKSDHSWP
jgi:NAD-dependent SIR2 family protein deacetylase